MRLDLGLHRGGSWFLGALVTTTLAVGVGSADFAAADSTDSGSKTCQKGNSAVVVAHAQRWAVRMNVKLAGPPSSPGFGARVKANPSAPAPDTKNGLGWEVWAYPTTWAGVNYSATSQAPDDWHVRAGVQCTRAPAGQAPVRWSKKLGSKTCKGKRRPTVYGLGHGTVRMSFRHTRSGPVQRVKTHTGQVIYGGGMFVNDRSIFDARIVVRSAQAGENWMDYHYYRCNRPKYHDPSLT